MERQCFVYCLSTVDEPFQTYIGATMNVEKRLQQHNGLLAGGARYTSKRPKQWYRICYVRGFSDWKHALSFEWHWKHFSRKEKEKGMTPLDRRQKALDSTLIWAAKKGMVLEIMYG